MNTEQKIIQVAIEDIIPNRFQPRLAFDEEGLKELSESIRQHGIIQPLVLRRLGNKYEIIAGERRFKASTMAGLRNVPAIISDIDDNKSAEIALVENIQRRNLTPIEEAKSYKNLLDRGYMTQEQLAKKMGISQSAIANKLRLLNLDEEVQQALLNNQISERHARSLLVLSNNEEQKKWLKKILAERLTVRQLDLEIKKAKGEIGTDTKKVSKEPNKTSMNNTFDNQANEAMNQNTITEDKKIEERQIPNKFFNFLEDEAANMNIEMPFKTKEEGKVEIIQNEIEVLDDFETEEKQEEVMPFFFESTKTENKIEEIKPIKEEDILINPMDSVIKLDPNYNKIVEEEKGLD